MFVAAFTKEIPDYGDPTTNRAESMFANIKRLIRQYFGETRPGLFLLFHFILLLSTGGTSTGAPVCM